MWFLPPNPTCARPACSSSTRQQGTSSTLQGLPAHARPASAADFRTGADSPSQASHTLAFLHQADATAAPGRGRPRLQARYGMQQRQPGRERKQVKIQAGQQHNPEKTLRASQPAEQQEPRNESGGHFQKRSSQPGTTEGKPKSNGITSKLIFSTSQWGGARTAAEVEKPSVAHLLQLVRQVGLSYRNSWMRLGTYQV